MSKLKELQKEAEELQKKIDDFKAKIKEQEKHVLALDRPCLIVDTLDGEVYAVLYYKDSYGTGWADPLKDKVLYKKEHNGDSFIVRYLTDEEILELTKTGTISDLGEGYDEELAQECREDGWIYLGKSSNTRPMDRKYWRYQVIHRDGVPWSDSINLSVLGTGVDYRKRLK